eukprot:1013805_1
MAVDQLGYDEASVQLGDAVVKAQYISQYEEIKRQQYGNKKGKKNKKKDDKKWWNFTSSSTGDKEGKYDDDFDDIDFKMENKVWTNLNKSTRIINNYERMDTWVDDGDDFKMDYSGGGSGKKSSGTKVDQNKVIDIVNMGMGFTMQQIQNAIVATNNGSSDIVIDYILNNPTAHENISNNNDNNNDNNNNAILDNNISGIDDDKIDENTMKIHIEKKKQAKKK